MSQTFDELLDAPFAPGAEQPLSPVEVDRRLGFNSAPISLLEAAVFEDLSPEHHGVGWWASTAPWDRRILVADYLYTSMGGVRKGLRQSILHLREARRLYASIAERYRDHALRVGRLEAPASACLGDELANEHADMHVAGFFRALATVLDCLAAALVGVVPVPVGIQKVGWRGLRSKLKALAKKPAGAAGEQRQASCASEVLTLLTHGPAGWIEWVIGTRNLLAHRPPRVRFGNVDFGSHLIASPSPENIRVTQRLWRHPDVSEVEVWVQYGHPQETLLNEPQELTMSRLVREVSELAGKLGSLLHGHWEWRRANPNELPQPVEDQWPDRAVPDDYEAFPGFMPEYPNALGDELHVPEESIRRMCAASADGPNILKWDRLLERPTRRPGLAMPARIRWLSPEEGGRADPPSGKTYSTIARFDDAQGNWHPLSWSVVVAFTFAPTEAIVSFLVPEAPHEMLRRGVAFKLYEGAKKVAEGRIE